MTLLEHCDLVSVARLWHGLRRSGALSDEFLHDVSGEYPCGVSVASVYVSSASRDSDSNPVGATK
jgi:hypothetical protein